MFFFFVGTPFELRNGTLEVNLNDRMSAYFFMFKTRTLLMFLFLLFSLVTASWTQTSVSLDFRRGLCFLGFKNITNATYLFFVDIKLIGFHLWNMGAHMCFVPVPRCLSMEEWKLCTLLSLHFFFVSKKLERNCFI